MPSATSLSPPSYALAAGAKPATRRTSAPVSKDESQESSSSASVAAASASTVSAVSKDAVSTVTESGSASQKSQDQILTAKTADLSVKDKDATATSNDDAPSSSAPSAAATSSSSSTTSTSTGDSVSSAELATPSVKPNLMPAPVPKVNVWKMRQDTLPARPAAVSAVDPTPAELVVSASGETERKSSRSSVDLGSKDWPAVLEDENSEKKENSTKTTKRAGKEKWIPYAAPLTGPPKPTRNGKPFAQRSANGTGRSASVGNVEGPVSGDDHISNRAKNFSRGNKLKSGSVNGTSEKKPTFSSTTPASVGETKEQKQFHKKHHDKKEFSGDEVHAKPLRAVNAPNVPGAQAETGDSLSDTPTATQTSSPTASDSEQSSISASAPHLSGKTAPPNKARTQRTFNQHQPGGANGTAPRSSRNNEYHNSINGVNGTGVPQVATAPGQQAPYQSSRAPHQGANGGHSGSPLAAHNNPQFPQQQQPHFAYQSHHTNNTHHNNNNYNQFRRASAPSYQPVAARGYYPSQQEYAAMFGFPQAFPSHPALIPGYSYEPTIAAAVLAQVDYYFSIDNLCKDLFLRRNMNSFGLVPLNLLAGFNRLKNLINGDLNLLTEACRQSYTVELIGNKVRSRESWGMFVMPYDERLPQGQEEEVATAGSPTEAAPATNVSEVNGVVA